MMDADSSAGQVALEWARIGMRAYQVERNKMTDESYVIETTSPSRETGCVVDGIIATVGRGEDFGIPMLTCVIEAKARFGLRLEKLRDVYSNRILIDESKLNNCFKLSRLLHTPLWSLTVLVSSSCYLVMPLTDTEGRWLVDFDVETRHCRKTINNPDRVKKSVALVDMESAHIYEV